MDYKGVHGYDRQAQSTMNHNAYQRPNFHDGRVRLLQKKAEQSRIRSVEVVEVDNVVQRNDVVTEDLCELIEIDREEFYRKTSPNRRALKKYTNVDRGDHVVTKWAMVHIDDEQLHESLHLGHAGPLRIGDENTHIMNLVKEEEEPRPRSSKRVKREKLRGQIHSHKANKGKNVVDEDCAALAMVKIENDKEYVVHGKEDCKRPFLRGEEFHSQNRNSKRAKCSNTNNVGDAKDPEGEDDGRADSEEVEIIDISAFVEKRMSCPFVSSRKFHKSMFEDESTDAQDLGPSTSDDFREDVLRVLSKPFDREEYRMYREEIKTGSYLDHHRDVQRRLTKYRYRHRKCLVILRGFFYWLQNLTREGAFQPWRDKECLAVNLTGA